MNSIKVYLIKISLVIDCISNIFKFIYLAPITAVSLPGFIIPLTESIEETQIYTHLKLNTVEELKFMMV